MTHDLLCSFCGADGRTAEVVLIAGPTVYICSSCVGLAVEVLGTERVAGRATRLDPSVERAAYMRRAESAEHRMRARIASLKTALRETQRALNEAIDKSIETLDGL